MTAALSQAEWDAKWVKVHRDGIRQGMTQKQAIDRAYRLMDQWGHGERPAEETTK